MSIRLFEIEAILKKWASRVESYRQASGVLRFAKRCRMTLRDTCYRSYLNQLLREVRGTGGGPPALEKRAV